MTGSEASNLAPASMSTILQDKVTLIAFLSFIIVSGGASVAIRLSYAELPTFWSGAAHWWCLASGLARYCLSRNVLEMKNCMKLRENSSSLPVRFV